MSAARRVVVAGLLAASVGLGLAHVPARVTVAPVPAPVPAPDEDLESTGAAAATAVPSLDRRELLHSVDLARAAWSRNGRLSDGATQQGPEDAPFVLLPCRGEGTRWSTTFTTEHAAALRLGLAWRGAPDGLLVEVMLDGQTLQPVRDAWRPTERALRTDLGPFWLGDGEHLLEFIARESTDAGALRLSELELRAP